MMLIFHNQKSAPLTKEVAGGMGADLGQIEKKVFPDGEIYIRLLTPVRGRRVVLVHTTKDNDDLVELILVLSALRDNGASHITCIVPHLVYQRQDEAFKDGEAVSARVFLRIIDEFADEIITVNAHFLKTAGRAKFGGVEVTNLDAFPLLGRRFRGRVQRIFSPDEGSLDYAAAAAREIGCPYDHLVKKRIDGTTVEIQPKELDVRGLEVLILDDIIATGGTMKEAAEMLRSQGARKVYLACVHGIFAKGLGMFKDMEVVCTDSLPTGVSRVSLAPIILKALK